MDIPVKKLARLLKPDQPLDVRASAVVMLAELGVKDAEAYSELITCLDDESELVRIPAIKAVGKLKIGKALPVLIERIKIGGPESTLAAESAAKLGAEGVKALQNLMAHVAPGLRRYIAAALTGAGAAGANASVAVLQDKDPQVAAATATAMIGRIPTMPADQKATLLKELIAVASNKKVKLTPNAEMPIVRVLASLNDASAADVLWDRTLPPHAPEVRAAALQAVGGWTQTPTKEQWRRLFACASETLFQVVAPAVMVLNRFPVSNKMLDDWVKLLHAPDMAARRMAIDKIGDRDTAEVADGLMGQIHHADRNLRDAARDRLTKLEHGRALLATALMEAKHTDEAWQLARSMAPFVNTFSAKLRDDLFKQTCLYVEANDHRVDPLWFLLKEADATGLRDKMHDQAVAKRKKKDYDTALKYLKTLVRDPAVGFPIRLELAMCGLKKSDKEIAAESRANDACLRQFEHILGQDADEALKQIEKAKWLDENDFFYLGFHFSERLGKEKAFGAAMLKFVVQASPKSKHATAAKNKLKSVAAE